jgi:hypothetical protein
MGQLQERITSTKKGSITSVQAIYVPADDLTDPAPATTFAHLDSTIVLSRALASIGIYPAIDPLESNSTALAPEIVGEEHYRVRSRPSRCSSATKTSKTSSPSLVSKSFQTKTNSCVPRTQDPALPLAARARVRSLLGYPGRVCAGCRDGAQL